MYTIYDYLKFYKNKELSDINDIDLLFFSLLSYLPLNEYKGYKNFNDFIDYANDFKSGLKKGSIAYKTYELLEIVKDSLRYKEVNIYNPSFIKNNETQFGAITIKANNNIIISYKGTDSSYIGWIENFRLSYLFPTYTQKLAYNYLLNNTGLFDKNIYLVGHSKGGNLALSSLYQANSILLKKIKKAVNFDGPGFRYKEFNSERFNEVSDKIVNYIPTGSIVGVLMDNKEYNVVKSNEIAWKEHNPTSWALFGEFFIKGKLSSASVSIHTSSTINTRSFDYDKMEKSFEKLYTTLGKEYDSDFKIGYNELKNFYTNMKNIDPEIAKYLESIINSILKMNNKITDNI